MKKTISIILVIVMHISLFALVGFDKQISNIGKKDILSFGLGVNAAYGEIKDASAEEDGTGEAVVDVAAVLVDNEGKIVKCVLDCASSKVQFSGDGKVMQNSEFKTKRELGDSYGMVAYAGATAEWYAQADSFAKLCEGKTIDEIKALVAEGDKGTQEVITAGCTIMIDDFVKSIELAVANAAQSKATAESELKLGIVTSQTSKDATADGNGEAELATTVVAAVVDGEVVNTASTDVAAVKFIIDSKGKNLTDTSMALQTKKQLGDNYGMALYGQDLNGDGVVKEWYDQAKAFNISVAGKTADEISALAVQTGYGNEALQTAGCTIHVGDMVKAVVKAAAV